MSHMCFQCHEHQYLCSWCLHIHILLRRTSLTLQEVHMDRIPARKSWNILIMYTWVCLVGTKKHFVVSKQPCPKSP